ncbi:MAG: glycosyltransferase [Nitrospirae bacterium CG_4_10_14_0_8_um_filter_41_23]|nr:MAG: glycosyltransferase [Nitrospirae bacterium CG11_big_fil_rev_8_21_14_0_20_41_14]PIV44794.1 MAG: glycosyltransferase [Nitrospirae bacterium CG02_land_8_20_14_3_00_41_53]PIW87010.1 MAG: glycosyltransferase [Nitrospirae bacterium CG_4_8_14_3_um_filter_41_47]PIY86973.1 MAG: glycosyltransferase [Nitrospirae bacterium CG_4_10_14_0_8_um_filter_41_23]PJA79962.1 MAG: glycosyltransferase [Nitrospirae bacterium CG_4_9_14_3_um_filter_41_27]
MTLSVVIPLYNEEENVQMLFERLKGTLDHLKKEYEIIFVDDGSTDRTLSILEDIQAKDKNVVVLSLRRNFGQTAAFAAGFDFARGDVIVTMDGDLQNDPADIPKLLELIKDNDLVSGWRRKRKDPFFTRRLPSIMANWLISNVTGVKLHDYGCSLKAYRRDVIKNLKLYGEMHRFIPAVASWYGVRIAEVETVHHQRLRGKSKYGISRTMKVVLDLITVKFLQSFSTKPIQFFGPVGIVSGFLGFLILLYLSIDKLFFGRDIGGRPLLLLGTLLIIVGIQLIGMGLLGEMLVRVYHESQKKPIYVIKKILGP